MEGAMIYRPPPRPDWTILGRGPSLRVCTEADVLPGSRVVAVNGAIYHHAIRADYLVGNDYPDQWLEPTGALPWGDHPAPEIVVVRDAKWAAFRAQHPGLTYRAFPGGNGGDAEIALLLGERRSIKRWGRWSILTAIAWARWGGAKRIRLLGVDMTGTGRAYGRGNRINEAERWGDRGNKSEARNFATAMESCRAAGVEVERYTVSAAR